MKFLCVECDEAMRLEGTHGPDRGSMTVIFACPACGRQTAMLTNTMETQVVRSLGVKIGGRTVPSEPMEMVRGSLVDSQSEAANALNATATPQPSADQLPATPQPSADQLPATPQPSAQQPHVTREHHIGQSATAHAGAEHADQVSKCPFTGMVNEAFAQKESVRWSEGARRRMERIPEFARNLVMKGVEDTARAQGLEEVTEAVLDDVRGQFGM